MLDLGQILTEYGLPGLMLITFIVTMYYLVRSFSGATEDLTAMGQASTKNVSAAIELADSQRKSNHEILKAIEGHVAATATAVQEHIDTSNVQMAALDNKVQSVLDKLSDVEIAVNGGLRRDDLDNFTKEMKSAIHDLKSNLVGLRELYLNKPTETATDAAS